MKIETPTKPDASDRRVSDLIFLACQRRMWSDLARRKGRKADAEAHNRKYQSALKSLRTLGYHKTL